MPGATDLCFLIFNFFPVSELFKKAGSGSRNFCTIFDMEIFKVFIKRCKLDCSFSISAKTSIYFI